MNIRRLLLVSDTIHSEGGLPAVRPVTRVAACAVIDNPLAGSARDDVGELVPFGAELGELLVQKALAALPTPPSPTARRRSSGSPAISSTPPRSCIRAWASRCAPRSAAARRSSHRM